MLSIAITLFIITSSYRVSKVYADVTNEFTFTKIAARYFGMIVGNEFFINFVSIY